MNIRSKDPKPITVGHIRKLQKNWLQQSSPVLLYLGLFMAIGGILSLLIPNPKDYFTLPFTIIMLIFGIGSIALSFWSKKQAKKI